MELEIITKGEKMNDDFKKKKYIDDFDEFLKILVDNNIDITRDLNIYAIQLIHELICKYIDLDKHVKLSIILKLCQYYDFEFLYLVYKYGGVTSNIMDCIYVNTLIKNVKMNRDKITIDIIERGKDQPRIKTEIEMIDSLGDNWKDGNQYDWIDNMNYLLGCSIPYSIYNIAKECGESEITIGGTTVYLNLQWLITESRVENNKINKGDSMKTKSGDMKFMGRKDFMDITKRVWDKSAALNIESAKIAAKMKLGDFMNNKLADLILKNIPMPKWLTLIGGKRWLRPVIKVVISNFGIYALVFIESQGYKSKKAEFLSESMMLSGYSDLINLINTENITAIVDNIIDSVPESLLNESGFSDDVSQANDILKKSDDN